MINTRLLSLIWLSLSSMLLAKDSAVTLPPVTPGYGHGRFLSDIGSSPLSAETLTQLRAWCLHQSFGGTQQAQTALEHPRGAQALWLALTTHAVILGQVSVAEATAHLDHLHRQKALGSATVAFFTGLWQEKSPSATRAADFLSGWLQEHVLPALTARESLALSAATSSGLTALRCFEKNPSSTQSIIQR